MEGQRISHYLIQERIGGGGMGVVYRAVDERLQRQVAIKFLPLDREATPEQRARFVHEARAASALDHKNVCTIHEIDEAPDGRTFIVMACYPGESLRERLRRGPLALDEALRIGVQLAEGLAAAHARDIVHRDVKPANVMLADDGEAKLVDFGLAKLEGQTRVTRTGSTLGTVAYMAPEQARGEEVDGRADVFSLGAVLYEMVAGAPPFAGAHDVAVLGAVLGVDPPDLGTRREGVPADLGALVAACLSKEPAARPSAHQVGTALRRLEAAMGSPTPDGRDRDPWARRAVPVALSVAVVLVVVVGVQRVRARADRAWVSQEAVPQIAGLLGQGRHADAYELVRQALERAPDDPVVEELAAAATVPLSLTTEPPGATVWFRPYLKSEAPWVELGRTPTGAVVPGDYGRFRVELEGYESVERGGSTWFGGFYEALVPVDEAVPGMVRVPEGVYSELADGHVEVRTFLIDTHEVTNARFQTFVEAGGYANPEYWPEALVRDFGSFEAGVAAFTDATGRPGPAAWSVGAYPEEQEDFPVGGVSWYEAAAFCAYEGKRLPTLFHWSLATGSQSDAWAEITILSNFSGRPRAVGSSGAVGGHGAYDMAGNVAEWVWTEGRDGTRYTLGGGFDDPPYLYVEERAWSPVDRSADRGFRCARYDAEPGDRLMGPVADPVYDFGDREVVDDRVFAEWERFYQYDPRELDVGVESVEPGLERFDREIVSFAAAYGDERVVAHVFTPRGVDPPYQTVIYSPGGTAYVLRSSATLPDMNHVDFILRSGRAFVYPVYAGSYERGWDEPSRGPAQRRERSVMQLQDLMRAVDFVEAREDLDAGRLAYMGISAGAEYGANNLAIERRFQAAVWVGGGYDPTHMQHEQPFQVPWNYAPRVETPVLMINGSRDYAIPVETGQEPLFQDLGTPPEHKRHLVFEGGHIAPQNDVIRETLDWLDRYLGPVR